MNQPPRRSLGEKPENSPSEPGPARLTAALTAVYAAVLLWATHYPKPEEFLGKNPPSDKGMHVMAYTLLGGLVAASLAAAGRSSTRAWLTAAAALAVFGALDEATQPLPWFRRTADPVDWVFDLAGIALGIAVVAGLAALAGRLRRRRRDRSPSAPTARVDSVQ